MNTHPMQTKEPTPMTARIWTSLAAGLLLIQAGTAWAGSETRIGTGGAHELRLPVGARTVGMFGANVGNVAGAEALFYNPAGIAATEAGTEVAFSYARQIADMNLNYVAISQKMGGFGSLGFSAKVLSVGDMIYTSETAPDGTGEIFSPTFSTLGLTYGKAMTDRVNFGATVYYISERVRQASTAGVAFDFGFQYDTGFQGVKLGLAMKNYGPPQAFGGSDFERNQRLDEDDPQAAPHTQALQSSEFELPSAFSGAISWPVLRGVNNLTLHGLYQSNSYDVDELRAGAEFNWRRDFALRVGYMFNSHQTEEDETSLFGLSYGAGVRVPLGAESSLYVDYAGQAVSDFFDDVQHVGVTFTF